MKPRGVSVRIIVDRFDECFQFYSEVLGGDVTWGKPGENYAEFKLGDSPISVGLFRREAFNSSLEVFDSVPSAPRSDYSTLVIEVDDVDAWANRIVAVGIPQVFAPVDRPQWGFRTVHFRDPDGNLIELNKPLGA